MSTMANAGHIAIAGAGSIGCFIGGLLQNAGHSVHFLARERVVKTLSRQGLHLTDFAGMDLHLAPESLSLETLPESLNKADIILVTVKSAATAEMGKLIAQYAKPSATIISLQNGLANINTLRSALPDHRVLAGMVPFNVAQMEKARFHRGTSGNIVIDQTRENLAAKLSSPPLTFEQSDNMPAVQSGKLLINLNNALNALSGISLLQQLETRGWRKLMAAQMDEALAIMKAHGMKPKPPSPVPAGMIPYILRLPTPLFKRVAKRMLTIDPLARSSMWEDLEAGRKTEIEDLQGEVLRLAEKAGMTAPFNRKVLEKIMDAEAQAKGSPNLKPEDI